MSEIEEQEQIAQRRAKLRELRKQGNPFPNDFRRNVMAGELHAEYDGKSETDLAKESVRVKVAGRLMTRRVMGKASFVHIQDMSGRIQLYVQANHLAAGRYEEFRKWDLGDIIGAEGTLFKTRTGELTVRIDELSLLAKAIRPLPDKYHGLVDQELRYRQRYLDLIMNEVTRKTFFTRTAIINEMRRFLSERGFLEVETPMMQSLAGGASARPFTTHHNALDLDLYLRVAPELYLKRLVVGGFEKVFEINRNFRNEGLSTRHNPEFTMLEFYQAYSDHRDLMDLTEQMLGSLAEKIHGSRTITYQGQKYDFSGPFQRLTVREALLKYNIGLTVDDIESVTRLCEIAGSLDIPVRDHYGPGKLQIEIFEKTVEQQLQQPTFITAYPVEVSPLSRRNDADPGVADRFELYIAGREIANGFSELNDAEDQAERFQRQLQEREAGDEEAMHYDADYIRALEHGMPPTAGEGVGIDRLMMLFTDAPSIRDVLLFPHLRPGQ